MPISAEAAQRVALHTLGFSRWPENHEGGLVLANEAGRWLCSTHNWTFLDGADTLLAVTAAQDYVALPSDFQAVNEIEKNGGQTTPSNWWCWTSLAEITRMRGQALPSGGWTYWGAVGYRQVEDGVPVPVLEIYPTPSATEASALRLRYRRQWRDFTADHDQAAIPGWMDALYLEAVRAFALGTAEERSGTLDQRLVGVLGGALMAVAIRRDVAQQKRYGLISGGAASGGRRYTRNPNIDILNP